MSYNSEKIYMILYIEKLFREFFDRFVVEENKCEQ